MKVDSCGRDIKVSVSEEEAKNLPQQRLEGVLKFFDPESEENRKKSGKIIK